MIRKMSKVVAYYFKMMNHDINEGCYYTTFQFSVNKKYQHTCTINIMLELILGYFLCIC